MSKKPKPEKISFWTANKRFYYYAAGLLVLAFLAQLYSLWGGFTMGDYFAVQPLFGVAPKEWNRYFMELFANGFLAPFTSPMSKVSLALDFQSGRWGPAAYHATNLLLHIGAVLSGFLLMARLNDLCFDHIKEESKRSAGLLAILLGSAIFAVHPALSDTVASLGGRAALLAFIFYMLAVYCFTLGLHARKAFAGIVGYVSAYMLTGVGLFASCQIVTAPLSMVAVGLLSKPPEESWKDYLYGRAWELGAAVMVAIGLPFLLGPSVEWPAGNGLGQTAMSASAYFATELKALPLFYLRNYFAPVGMTIDPRYARAENFSDPLVLAGALTLGLVLIVLALFMGRKRTAAFFGMLLFVLGFFPLVLLPQPEYASGYRLYLPAFGLSIVLGQLLAPMVLGDKLSIRALGRSRLIALGLVGASLIGLSVWRDRAYSTNSALFRGALRQDKDNYRLRSLFAMLLTTDSVQLRKAAEDEARTALKSSEELPCAFIARGVWASYEKDYRSSAFCFDNALKLAQKQNLSREIVRTAEFGLVTAEADFGTFDNPTRSVELARDALKLYAAKPRLYLALGKALMAEGRPESAEAACREFDKGRRFDRNDPDFAVPNAVAALKTGYPIRFEQAYGAAKTIYRITPGPTTLLLLARASLESGRIWRGITLMQQYYQSYGKANSAPAYQAEAYFITSGLARQIGDTKSEKQYLERALKLNPAIEKNDRLFLTVKPKPKADELKGEDAIQQGNAIIDEPKPIQKLLIDEYNAKKAEAEKYRQDKAREEGPKAAGSGAQ